jgi:2-dehydro-3-deoxygluconokinase
VIASSDQFYITPSARADLVAIGEGMVELRPTPSREGLAVGFGGDASNVAVMAARLGASASLIARVGLDWSSERLLAFWSEEGINQAAVTRDADTPGALYLNDTTEPGRHTFAYWRQGSAGSRLGPEHVDAEFVCAHRLLVFTGITLAISATAREATRAALRFAKAGGTPAACILNHRPVLGGDIDELAELAAVSDIVIGSREDARLVFGEGDPRALGRRLPDVSELVLTDGPGEACALARGELFFQAPPSVRVLNAGGAGDALAGAFLASRLAGSSIAESLAVGVAASAASVGREGCALGYPAATEVSDTRRELPESRVEHPYR